MTGSEGEIVRVFNEPGLAVVVGLDGPATAEGAGFLGGAAGLREDDIADGAVLAA